MAYGIMGTVTPSPGTGNKTFNLGGSCTRLWILIGGLAGGAGFLQRTTGIVMGSANRTIAEDSTFTSDPVNKALQWLDGSGNVIMEANFVAWTATGVTLNFTTIPSAGSIPQLLLIGDNY